MFDLTNKVAIVTGGNGGLGLAFAKGLAKRGCSIAIWARNEDKNAKAVKELQDIGANATAFACDILQPKIVARVFQETVDHFGKVDICVANAGGGGFSLAAASFITRSSFSKQSAVETPSVVSSALSSLARIAAGSLRVMATLRRCAWCGA